MPLASSYRYQMHPTKNQYRRIVGSLSPSIFDRSLLFNLRSSFSSFCLPSTHVELCVHSLIWCSYARTAYVHAIPHMHFLIRHHAAYNFWKHQSTVGKQIYIKSCLFDCFFDNRSGTNGTEIAHAKHATKLQRSKHGHASNHSQIYVAHISGFAWSFLPPSSITPSCEKSACKLPCAVLSWFASLPAHPSESYRRAVCVLIRCYFFLRCRSLGCVSTHLVSLS